MLYYLIHTTATWLHMNIGMVLFCLPFRTVALLYCLLEQTDPINKIPGLVQRSLPVHSGAPVSATYFASNSPGTGPALSTRKFIPFFIRQLLFFPHIAGYCSFSTSGPEPRATNQSVCCAGLSAKFLPILLLFSSRHAFPKASSSVD